MALLIVLLGVVGGCTRNPFAAAPATRSLASLGSVKKDPAGEVIELRIYGGSLSAAEFAQIGELRSLQSLTVQESELPAGSLAQLAGLPNLHSLRLIRVAVSDPEVEGLRELPALRVLELTHTSAEGRCLESLADLNLDSLEFRSHIAQAATMQGIIHLASVTRLELHCSQFSLSDLPDLGTLQKLDYLACGGTRIGPSGLIRLQGLTALTVLIPDGTEISDENIEQLNALVQLRKLYLNGATVSDAGLKRLKLPRLQSLALEECEQMTDAGLANLGGVPMLTRLTLMSSSVDGSGLVHLTEHVHLRDVMMNAAQFKASQDVIARLKSAIPEVRVSLLRG